MILVAVIIGIFLFFMFATVVYVTSQVANCSSGKKLRKQCTVIIPDQKLNHRLKRHSIKTVKYLYIKCIGL